jgi:spermidine synthase
MTQTAISEMWLTPMKRLHTIHADARVALQKTGMSQFDIIVGDAFHDIVIPPHLVTREFFELIASRLSKDGLYLMNVVDHQHRPRLALSIWRTMRAAFSNVEIWRSNETGTRTTFVLAAVAMPTPQGLIATPATPGTTFRRLSKTTLQRLVGELQPLMLTDDYTPVDRLIGVE